MKFEVFIPGILQNTKNYRKGWRTVSEYVKGWRGRTESYLLTAFGQQGWEIQDHAIRRRGAPRTTLDPALIISDRRPKVIRIHSIVAVRFDDEGMYVAMAPIVDALQWGKKIGARTVTRKTKWGTTITRTVPERTLPGVPIIHNDGPDAIGPYEDPDKHTIIRTQEAGRPARATPMMDPRGVRITITLKEA